MKKGNSIKLKIAVIISIIITIFWLLPYIYVICCSFKPRIRGNCCSTIFSSKKLFG